MTTPIYDFVKKYAESKTTRFHMPGHKGVGQLGCEMYDITEVKGADVLYSAEGIIEESENNLTELYDTGHSFYSTEGSTLAIKAMLAIVTADRKEGERPIILASRNAHVSFIHAAAMLDIDVLWMQYNEQIHLCSGTIYPRDVQTGVENLGKIPTAVYITSPDYLGNMTNIETIFRYCRWLKIPIIVDNAHGAYLKFLKTDFHPIALGAAMCVDSAHKTLPVLTGGAYLHISKKYPKYIERARGAFKLFASTSPSYLTLASLDLCNEMLANGYAEEIKEFEIKMEELKSKIRALGYKLNYDDLFGMNKVEPFKIAIRVGKELAEHLRSRGIEPEYSDFEYTVLMLSPRNTDEDIQRLLVALDAYEGERCVPDPIYALPIAHEQAMTIREATFAPSRVILAKNSLGRICAAPLVSCPPAVPIVMSGERITKEDIRLFKHYGIEKVSVVIEPKAKKE
ncbi:MAG: amino acid decarboxylase [Clostridia bacterium]|nr:amino acid decarboxylase [Clostridia bacterium]